MKPLNLRQAQRCETAKHGRCRCRCGGVLHGAARGMDEEFFRALPEDDPHRAMQRKPRARKVKPLAALPLFDGEVDAT